MVSGAPVAEVALVASVVAVVSEVPAEQGVDLGTGKPEENVLCDYLHI